MTGFPCGSDGKESAWNAGDRDSIPGSRSSPGGGHGNPLQVFLPGESHGQRSLAGYSPWCPKSRTWLSDSHFQSRQKGWPETLTLLVAQSVTSLRHSLPPGPHFSSSSIPSLKRRVVFLNYRLPRTSVLESGFVRLLPSRPALGACSAVPTVPAWLCGSSSEPGRAAGLRCIKAGVRRPLSRAGLAAPFHPGVKPTPLCPGVRSESWCQSNGMPSLRQRKGNRQDVKLTQKENPLTPSQPLPGGRAWSVGSWDGRGHLGPWPPRLPAPWAARAASQGRTASGPTCF